MKYLAVIVLLIAPAAQAQTNVGGICFGNAGQWSVRADGKCYAEDGPKTKPLPSTGTGGGVWPSTTISGSSLESGSNVTLNGGNYTSPNAIYITKSSTCRLVVLEDNDKQIVIGCRKELK